MPELPDLLDELACGEHEAESTFSRADAVYELKVVHDSIWRLDLPWLVRLLMAFIVTPGLVVVLAIVVFYEIVERENRLAVCGDEEV